jgi:hypothetical protein
VGTIDYDEMMDERPKAWKEEKKAMVEEIERLRLRLARLEEKEG